MLRCETKFFPAGTIIADSKGTADALLVITSGKVIRTLKILKISDLNSQGRWIW